MLCRLLLSGSLKVTADIVNVNFSTYGVWMGYWAPSGNYVPNASLFTYNFTNVDYQVWTPLYSNVSNYNALETRAAANPALVNYQAIAAIMKAYDFQALVDVYNNVPYTEAFKGIEAKGGFLEALKNSVIQDIVMKDASLLQKQFEDGTLVLVGVNKFKNANETAPVKKGTIINNTTTLIKPLKTIVLGC